jgi:type IV pilus assembly protein PilB
MASSNPVDPPVESGGESSQEYPLPVQILIEARVLDPLQVNHVVQRLRVGKEDVRSVLLEEISWQRVLRNLQDKVVLHTVGGKTVTTGQALVEAKLLTTEELNKIFSSSQDSEEMLANALLQEGAITEAQLKTARDKQTTTGHPLWRQLLNLDYVVPKQLADAMRKRARVMPSTKDEDVVALLVDRGTLSNAQVDHLKPRAEAAGKNLGWFLVDERLLSEVQYASALADHYQLPLVDLGQETVEAGAADTLPQAILREHHAAPLLEREGRLRVAVADPATLDSLETVAMLLGYEVDPVVATRSQVRDVMERQLGAEMHGEMDEAQAILTTSSVSEEENVDARIILNGIFEGSKNTRATDIHFDPYGDGVRVRFRIDGILQDIMDLRSQLAMHVYNRIKVLANMNIAERRHPQDGHLTAAVADGLVEMRVSSVPTPLGEKMSLRVFNEENIYTGLNQLGFEDQQLNWIRDILDRPAGMILAVGPVGSGKTTTLYSMLNEVNILQQNVMTIEDPIEYDLKGVNQIQADYALGLDFATGLRAILRHDPDIAMVGEVRDDETAKISTRAALTGLLVLSTIHASDSAAAIATLVNYGVPGFLVAQAVAGIIGQRLVRRICESCKISYKPDLATCMRLGLTKEESEGLTLYRGTGCRSCLHTGYRGRTGIFELLSVDAMIRDLILIESPKDVIRQTAIENGMITLQEAALHKVREGVTTPDEVFRVLHTE